MRGLILAAGRGSRMGRRTDILPKTLTKLKGISLYERIIKAFRSSGLQEVGAVVGYRRETLVRDDVHYFVNQRWSETNMVSSLLCATAWLEESPVVVSYGDIFYKPIAITGLEETTGDIVLTYDPHWEKLWSRRFANPLEDAETFLCDKAGHLVEIGNRPKSIQLVRGQYMGLLKFTPAGWKEVVSYLASLPAAEIDRLDMTGLLSRLLAESVCITTIPYKGAWGEVDHEEDILLYEEMMANGQLAGI